MRHETFMKLKADEEKLMDEYYTKQLSKKRRYGQQPLTLQSVWY